MTYETAPHMLFAILSYSQLLPPGRHFSLFITIHIEQKIYNQAIKHDYWKSM